MSTTTPHNLEAEKAVLGAVLVHNPALVEAERIVQPADFFRDGHGYTFREMLALAANGQPIDLITLSHALGPEGVERAGGPAYLASLADGVPRSTNVAHYATIVRQTARQRALRKLCDDFLADPLAMTSGSGARFLEGVRREIDAAGATGGADRFVTAADSCRDQPHVPMLLEPYIPAASTGSVIAKIKLGKTSLLLEQTRCLLRGVGFCGHRAPGVPARILYATEQERSSFNKQLHDAGLQGDNGLIVTYLSAWHGQPWAQIAPALIERAIRERVALMVIDTASRWFRLKGDEENQSGSAENVQLLQPFTAQGGSVILSRHGRKSGGTASDAGRGTTAIDGAVDYILHLQRPAGQPAEVREIECVGRFDMPERLLVRRRANFETSPPYGFRDGGEVAARYVFEAMSIQAESPKSRIRAELLRGSRTAKQLSEALNLSVNTVNRTLEDMAGEVILVGKGGPKNNASLYGIREDRTTSPSPSLRDGQVQSSNQRRAG